MSSFPPKYRINTDKAPWLPKQYPFFIDYHSTDNDPDKRKFKIEVWLDLSDRDDSCLYTLYKLNTDENSCDFNSRVETIGTISFNEAPGINYSNSVWNMFCADKKNNRALVKGLYRCKSNQVSLEAVHKVYGTFFDAANMLLHTYFELHYHISDYVANKPYCYVEHKEELEF